MRINRFVAMSSTLSRRAADQALKEGRVYVNGVKATLTSSASESDKVMLDGKLLLLPITLQTILLNKPTGYVVSRNGQGSKTIYDLLPTELSNLKPVGRLDKDSSGLLLLTNNGELTQQLTHPSFQKVKVYETALDKDLQPLHHQMISDVGISLDDGLSKLGIERMHETDARHWRVTMHEGRNRQIRRTFTALGYKVTTLHRTTFGIYKLPHNLQPGSYQDY